MQRSNFSHVVNAASQKVGLKGDDDREEAEVEVNCKDLLSVAES